LMFDPKKWDGLMPNLLDEHPFSEIGARPPRLSK